MPTKGMTATELEHRRQLAVERVQQGWKEIDVAKLLGVSDRSVRRWVQAFREVGSEGLKARPRPGARPKLTVEQERVVLSWFEQSPTKFGFPNELWTGRRVADLILRTFGVKFNSHYVVAWLARRRITPQKPQRQPREKDEDEIARWARIEWPRIVAEGTINHAHIVFIDESGALLGPLVRRTLAPRGKTPILKQKGSHRERVSMIAALALSPVRHHVSLYFDTLAKDHFNAARVEAFLHALLKQIPGRAIVIWDRGNIHKGPLIRRLLAKFPRLTLESLPPYAPELDPVEQLWNHVKYQKLANYAPPNAATLHAAVREVLAAAKSSPARIKTFWAAAALPPCSRTLTT